MKIVEFRVLLPMTVEEYQIGQLYSVAEASKNETGGGEGVEVLKNESYSNHPLLNGKFSEGQFTHKIYHLASKVPTIVRLIAPKGSLEIHEQAWNAYPYCKTVLTNPHYMKDNFFIRIETMHLPDGGNTENAHELPKELLAKREVVYVSLLDDSILSHGDIKPEIDLTKWHSEKTGRGPLKKDWVTTTKPVMCAYKLVTCEFKWFGLQNKVEKYIQSVYPRMFGKFHREVTAWMDKWYGLTMADIRAMEEKTQKELEEQRKRGSIRGMKPD